MIDRFTLKKNIKYGLKNYPITLILGPPGCGKSCLGRLICDALKGTFFEMNAAEPTLHREFAKTQLRALGGLVVIDDIQLEPLLYPILKALSEEGGANRRFLVLAHASTETRALLTHEWVGFVHGVEMTGFALSEVEDVNALWIRGGFPRSFLASTEVESEAWRGVFLSRLLEQDRVSSRLNLSLADMRRLWTLLFHSQGQSLNWAELGRAMGVRGSRIQMYIEQMEGGMIARVIEPYSGMGRKRLVKSPIFYFRDTGLAHFLGKISSLEALHTSLYLGASWAGFGIEQLALALPDRCFYYYQTHAGAHLDLMIEHDGQKIGVDFKYQDQPATTKSMHHVIEDLGLDRLWIVYPGEAVYFLTNKIGVTSLGALIASL